jgi:hypothetical protein
VPCRSRSFEGEKSPARGDADHCPLHTELAEELAMLGVAVSSVIEFVLGCSPNEAFRVQVVDELVAKF